MSRYGYLLDDNTDNTDKTCADDKAQPDAAPDVGGQTAAPSIVSNVSNVTGTCDENERAAICQFDAEIPKAWAEGFARLQASPRPDNYPAGQWALLISDVGMFLDKWAVSAIQLGWTAEDLFGVDAKKPSARIDNMGLVPLIRGREVIAITKDTCALRGSGGTITYYRHNRGGVPIWQLIRG